MTKVETATLIGLTKNLPTDVDGYIRVIQRSGCEDGGYNVYDLEAKLSGKEYEIPGLSLLPHLNKIPNYSDQISHGSEIAHDILWPASVLAIDLIDNYDGSDILLDEDRLINLSGWVNKHILLPKGKEKSDMFLFQNMKAITMRSVITVTIDGIDQIFRSKKNILGK